MVIMASLLCRPHSGLGVSDESGSRIGGGHDQVGGPAGQPGLDQGCDGIAVGVVDHPGVEDPTTGGADVVPYTVVMPDGSSRTFDIDRGEQLVGHPEQWVAADDPGE